MFFEGVCFAINSGHFCDIEFYACFRSNLRYLIGSNGLIPAEFARRSGLSRGTVSLLLRGKTCPDMRGGR